jgi:hypothetical protein
MEGKDRFATVSHTPWASTFFPFGAVIFGRVCDLVEG